MAPPHKGDLLKSYRDAGMDRTTLILPTVARDEALKKLDAAAKLMQTVTG